MSDKSVAERLSVIDPADYTTLEELRMAVVDMIETKLDEGDRATWNQAD